MKKEKTGKDLSRIPPNIPKNPSELERAIILVGNRIKAELKEKSRQELKKLLGAYPNAKEAEIWKHFLKTLRKERIETQEPKLEDLQN